MFEAIQQVKDDDVINGIIDEVIQPQLRQVIIELWRDIAESNRNKQIEKVTIMNTLSLATVDNNHVVACSCER